MGTNIMINLVDGVWHQSPVQASTLSFAQRVLPRRRAGAAWRPAEPAARRAGVSTVVRFDVVQDAQLVLYLPTPLKVFEERGCR